MDYFSPGHVALIRFLSASAVLLIYAIVVRLPLPKKQDFPRLAALGFLGVSLYQLLCGQLPFRAESMPRLMQKIATEPHAAVRILRPELPECIDPIIERVLSKSADERFPNCATFADALRRCAGQQDEPQGAEPKHEWLIP